VTVKDSYLIDVNIEIPVENEISATRKRMISAGYHAGSALLAIQDVLTLWIIPARSQENHLMYVMHAIDQKTVSLISICIMRIMQTENI
jgi:hypothetical protein